MTNDSIKRKRFRVSLKKILKMPPSTVWNEFQWHGVLPARTIGGLLVHDNLVASDVKSGVAVEQVGMNVPVKFGDPWSKSSGDIRTTHFVMGSDERRRTQIMA